MVSRGTIHSEKKGLREPTTACSLLNQTSGQNALQLPPGLERLNGREWVVLRPPSWWDAGPCPLKTRAAPATISWAWDLRLSRRTDKRQILSAALFREPARVLLRELIS